MADNCNNAKRPGHGRGFGATLVVVLILRCLLKLLGLKCNNVNDSHSDGSVKR